MLKGVPKILSPELLSVLAEMGHSDRICIGDGNFPGARMSGEGGCVFVRADGLGCAELLDAILEMIPLDEHIDKPVMLMEKAQRDASVPCPIWDEFAKIVEKHDARGKDAIAHVERFQFYEEAKSCYCILQSGEEAIYANVIVQKGVIK